MIGRRASEFKYFRIFSDCRPGKDELTSKNIVQLRYQGFEHPASIAPAGNTCSHHGSALQSRRSNRPLPAESETHVPHEPFKMDNDFPQMSHLWNRSITRTPVFDRLSTPNATLFARLCSIPPPLAAFLRTGLSNGSLFARSSRAAARALAGASGLAPKGDRAREGLAGFERGSAMEGDGRLSRKGDPRVPFTGTRSPSGLVRLISDPRSISRRILSANCSACACNEGGRGASGLDGRFQLFRWSVPFRCSVPLFRWSFPFRCSVSLRLLDCRSVSRDFGPGLAGRL